MSGRGSGGWTIGAALLFCISAPAQQVFYSVPGADAPELAHRGKYGVGVTTVELVNPGQADILKFEKESGKAPQYDRPLKVEVWYPAVIPAGVEERTTYESAMPGKLPPGVPKTFQIAGKALRNAAMATGERFPLVVVSHGYPGSRTFLSYLTENLASKGYVVAAIDHTDSIFGDVKAFASTLLNRSYDQLFVLDAFTKGTVKLPEGLGVDGTSSAIVGYSMGGYGALATAGAGYSGQAMPMKIVPGGYLEALTASNPTFRERQREYLKAVVAISPWGAQPPYNSWDDEGLAGLHIPALFIVGDRDDISGYEQGVKRIFDGAVNSERCMLVYENANHNVGGNPAPPEALADFTTRESFDEPVWRKDRITAINQHFITAFLDLYLKGDESRRSYLRLATVKSNDGTWPLPMGQSVGAAYSDGKTYWKGFQRRWALGLEMHCAAPSAR